MPTRGPHPDADPAILCEVRDGIGTITLHRPEQLNAMSRRMSLELIDALDRLDEDPAVRVVVVTGSGRAFCAGADLSAGSGAFAPTGGTDAPRRDWGGVLVLRLFEMDKPVLAAINGPAVGIGASMTLPMDARLSTPDARIGFVFSRRGLVPDAAASWFLPRVVGVDTALEWCFSGRVFPADEALERRLVRSLHPAEELVPVARALALSLVSDSAPVSVALTRQLIWRMLGAADPMDAHRADSRALAAQGASADAREGVTAFLEKRPAAFPRRVSTDLPDVWEQWPRKDFA